ncbi:HIT family protein [Membranihabitans maritimus]|uniref:HIT family protein n=1 Tax=Membranihabitans maritimus TaxID=2904244 RepID=UPI001F2D4BBF|nr:HIT family protein [Membranihabitans maritimus]
MSSIFTKIINKEIPSHTVAENENFIAFLDINPISKGHTLVVPKREIDYYFDLPDDLLGSLNIFAKKVAEGMKKVIPCNRIGVTVIGLEVPHAHIHLIPIDGIYDMDFGKPKLEMTQEELAEIAAEIGKNVKF